jgi:plasmid stabilization system protein ParE
MHLSFNADARIELDDARQHYAKIKADLARDFLSEIEKAIHKIKENPFAWPPYTRSTRRYLLSRFPYHVIYYIRSDDIVIVAVAHAKRDPSYWLTRIDEPQP